QEYTLRAQRYATLLEFDIIHAHDWLCYTAGMIAKKVSEKPLVTHIHATEYDRAGGAGDPRIHFMEFTGMHAKIFCEHLAEILLQG
ncbi:MAG: glycogen/starch synthase, partial [Candidatus Pacebacteria bacterium]|nr:glycogen/starch synthase [Candidatus Paceibacterota bacterium]